MRKWLSPIMNETPYIIYYFYINITATERLRKEGSTSDPYDLNEWGYTCTAMVITEIRKVERLIK